MKKIVVANLYGGKNLGDYAIRNSALKIIRSIYPTSYLHLLCESDKNFPIDERVIGRHEIAYAPYGYAIRSSTKSKSLVIKAYRLVTIYLATIYYVLSDILFHKELPKNSFYKYIKIIKNSDFVIFMGGGYLITANKFGDYFGILLNILPILLANIYRKRYLFLPMSFGPFASKVHEKIVGSLVKRGSFISREDISLKLVKIYNKSARLIPDLALLDWNSYKPRERGQYFILTFRESLTDIRSQNLLEIEIAEAIKLIWNKYKISCIYIPMASNPIEEDDLKVATRIHSLLNNSSLFQVIRPKTPDEAKSIISNALFSICNRLHSAIFSATSYTPFITISYAHKTIGFLNMLGLTKWNTRMGQIHRENILEMVDDLLNPTVYKSYINILKIERNKIVRRILHLKQSILDSEAGKF